MRSLAILRELRALGFETYQLTGPRQQSGALREETVGEWSFDRTPPADGVLMGIPGLAEIELIGEITYRIEQVVRRVNPQILHAHSPVLNAIATLRVGHRLDIPVVYECRALWEEAAVSQGKIQANGLGYRLSRAVESYALRHASAITVTCHGMRSEILGRGIDDSKLTVVPDGVDSARFAPERRPDPALQQALGLQGALVLGFVGTFQRHEGIELLLEALPAIARGLPEARLLLVGDGPELPALQQAAAALGVGERVVFAGRVEPAESPRYYSLVDIMVYPAHETRLTDVVAPFKLLEAMAAGCIVAASDVGGHRELLADRATGRLFRPHDAGALAEAIIDLAARRSTWPALAAAARQWVERERSWQQCTVPYLAMYERLAELPVH